MQPLFPGRKKIFVTGFYAVLFLAGLNAFSQTAELRSPAFDVVSIRQVEAVHTERGFNSVAYITTAHKLCDYTGARVKCQLSLLELLEEAFQRKSYEIVGPKWLAEDLFVVQATMPPGTSSDTARLMLQHTLEERFGLGYHEERRVISGYAMVPMKGGVKLQPAEDAAHRKLLSAGGLDGASLVMAPGQFSAVSISLESLAANVENMADLRKPVLNMTGLSGNYKIDLHWPPSEDPDYTARGKDPGIRNAVKTQLGLDLEKQDIPVRALVVDRIDRTPSAN